MEERKKAKKMKFKEDLVNFSGIPSHSKNKLSLNFQEWAKELFNPTWRYCIIHGGRGSGKSWGVAEALLALSLQKKLFVLCGREYQNSIKESVHALLKERISGLKLDSFFTVQQDAIYCDLTNSKFIFQGLRNNISSIKSMTGITHLWIEEGDVISLENWEVIRPTIREAGSQIWVTFNPKYKTDCIYKEFVAGDPPPRAYVRKVHYTENPYFTPDLEFERKLCLERNPDMYEHIWNGACLEQTQAQVFKGCFVVEEFEEDLKSTNYYGLDFGYSVDPVAAVRSFIRDNKLYITHEAVKIELEIDEIGQYCSSKIPGFARNRVVADSQQPGMISLMKRQGYPVVPAKKGKGSIEDGIAHIRSFDKVIIHPRCKETIKEFESYTYKIDARSGEITTDIVDRNNHCIDALRYSLERLVNKQMADYHSLTRLK